MSLSDDQDLLEKISASRPDRDVDLLRALHDSATDAVGSVTAVSGPPTADPEEWRRFGDLGWLGILVPGDLGGSGGDLAAAGVVARCLGRAGRREPYVAAGVLAPLWLLATSRHAGAAALIEPVASGTIRLVPAWQCRAGGLVINHSALPRLSMTGLSTSVSGVVHWVPAQGADGYLVVARGEDGPTLLHLAADAPGVTMHPVAMSDDSLWGHLVLRDVEIGRERLFPLDTDEVAALQRGVDSAVLTVSAELLGATETMFDLTTAYLNERRQFGCLIGSYQVLQHKAVDMWLQRELLSAALADCYARVDVAPHSLSPLASGAKSRACDASRKVANAAVQLHGAIGFTSEYALSQLVNRSLVLSAWLGNHSYHLARWASYTHGQSA